METMKAIALRKSTRGFKEEQIDGAALETILNAGCAAPVGMKAYDTLHISVVQDKELLGRIRAVFAELAQKPDSDLYYGAPTVIIISSKEPPAPGLDFANGACIADHMLLAVTDLGLANIFIWGTARALQDHAALQRDVGIPEGYHVVASVALGHAAQPDQSEKPLTKDISINRV